MPDVGLGHRRIPDPVPFSYAGALAATESTPWSPHRDSKVYGVRALLGTAGSSNTVVHINVNGSSVGSVTLGSGVTDNDAAFTADVAATDLVTAEVTSAGTGAEDLTVLLRVA